MEQIIYYNGDILTLEDSLYTPAILFSDGKIKKTGTFEEVKAYANKDATLIDLSGKTLMPSFIDAHSHFSGYANSLLQVSLEEAISFDEIKEKIQDFIHKNNIKPGVWILANKYDHNNLIEKSHPNKALLDEASPQNPCVIQHQSGHMGVFNSLALQELNITSETKDIEGGLIGKENGQPNGYLEENAYVDYIKKVPMTDMKDFFQALVTAQQNYASYGITTVQEGFIIKELAGVLTFLKDNQMMKLDLIGYVDLKHSDEILPILSDCIKQYKNHIKVGGYKTFLDGSPQGRTAWMETPYKGSEDYVGYPIYQDEDLLHDISKAMNDHMQLLCHCNGDAACAQYLHQYENARLLNSDSNDMRPVMIHAQLLRPDQLSDVKRLGIIPSFFVAHVHYWGDIHIKNFGLPRAKTISCAASAQKKGIIYTFHQDSPVIEPNMLETIWCAVNRITKEGVTLGCEERITVLEAIKAVTINAAYQYFEENIKGTLTEGKNADYIILSDNPLKVDSQKIKDIQVLETFKDGVQIYSRT